MKKCFLLSVVVLCAVFTVARAEQDPGQTYAEAFILAQDGQNAEANSDWTTAVTKYNAAADMLRGIRTSNPDWNPQVVEFRLRETMNHLAAVKAKAPAPPPAPEPPTAPMTAEPTPAAPPSAPGPLAVELATPQATSRLRAELDRLKTENARLSSELEEAHKTPAKPDRQADKLKEQNRQLSDQLSNTEKQVADLKHQLAAKPTGESAEIKKLRTELSQTRAELESAQQARQQLTDLQRQNRELSAKLTETEKQAAAALKSPSEAGDLKKLRAELAKARIEADESKQALAKAEAAGKERAALGKQLAELEKQNATLRDQLAAAKSIPQPKAPAAVESAELKKLRADLSSARSELENSRKANQKQLADLLRENKYLIARLATAQQTAATEPATPAAEAAELKKLKDDLAAACAEADRAKAATARIADLERQNKDLSAKLAVKPAALPSAAAESAELRKLQSDLASAHAEADQAKKASGKADELAKQNKDLSGKLTALQQHAADLEKRVAAKAAPAPAESSELKKLRADLAAAHSEVENTRKANQKQLADLQLENKNLAAQLATAQKTASVKPATPAAESAELKRLKQDLAAARAEADRAKAATGRVADLERQNKELSTKLAAKPAAGPESAELKKLRSELADARAAAERAKQANSRVGELERDNQKLSADLLQARHETTGRATWPQQNFGPVVGPSATAVRRTPAPDRQLADLQQQNAELKKMLDDAKRQAAAKPAGTGKSEELARENKDLSGKLSATQRRVAELEKQVAAKATAAPAESAELKKLRADLANARVEAQNAQAEAATKQSRQLESQLAASQARVSDLQKQVATKTVAPADTGALKKLRAELSSAQAEADRSQKASADATALARQNQELSTQLAAAKDQAAQFQAVRAELAAARADAEAGKLSAARAAELEKQNTDLAARLAEGSKAQFVRPLLVEESAEIRKLKAELDDFRSEISRAQSANARANDLAKQNAELHAQLEDARKLAAGHIEVVDRNPPSMQIAPPALSTKDAELMKKLRNENSYLRNLLESYVAKVPELKPRLQKYQPEKPAPSGTQ